MTPTWKAVVAAVAIALTFAGYVPYLRDTIKGKTKPHAFTWFIWAFATGIVFALQVAGGGGVGSLVSLGAAIACFTIFLFAVRAGDKDITRGDTMFFVLALIALATWLLAKQPVVSVIFACTADQLGFAPTVRKSWHRPHQETLIAYFTNTVRFVLAVAALQRYTFVTLLYPVSWVVSNGLFTIFLVVRRSQLGSLREAHSLK